MQKPHIAKQLTGIELKGAARVAALFAPVCALTLYLCAPLAADAQSVHVMKVSDTVTTAPTQAVPAVNASIDAGTRSRQSDVPVRAGKPVIGINCDIQGDKPRKVGLSSLYVEAIQKAGGVPLLLPPMNADDLSQLNLNGVMMIGGDDYPPTSYGQTPHPSVSIMDKSRSDFDMVLVDYVRSHKGMPFLGICAGCQALNIGSGGTLTQDIPSQKPDSKVMHASKDGWQKGFNQHVVEFKPDSKLAKILGRTSESEPTSHHQCVDKPGQNLVPIASTADGCTEGLEMTDRPFGIGVQFHPERAFDKNESLFKEFVHQADLYRTRELM